MVRVWVAGKTVWSDCYTRAISKRFRDKELIIKRYINSSVYFTYIPALLLAIFASLALQFIARDCIFISHYFVVLLFIVQLFDFMIEVTASPFLSSRVWRYLPAGQAAPAHSGCLYGMRRADTQYCWSAAGRPGVQTSHFRSSDRPCNDRACLMDSCTVTVIYPHPQALPQYFPHPYPSRQYLSPSTMVNMRLNFN